MENNSSSPASGALPAPEDAHRYDWEASFDNGKTWSKVEKRGNRTATQNAKRLSEMKRADGSPRYLVRPVLRGSLAALASREASPNALTNERIAELWVEHGLDEDDPESFARIIEHEVHTSLAFQEVSGAALTDEQVREAFRKYDAAGLCRDATHWQVWRDAFEVCAALASPQAAPAPNRQEIESALHYVDDFIARCNGDDRGSCESVNVLRRALAAPAPVAPTPAQPAGTVRFDIPAKDCFVWDGAAQYPMVTCMDCKATHYGLARLAHAPGCRVSEALATLPSEPEGEAGA